MRYIPFRNKVCVLFDKDEARLYGAPKQSTGIVLLPLQEAALDHSCRWEHLSYDRVLDIMRLRNPLIYREYMIHARRILRPLLENDPVKARFWARMASGPRSEIRTCISSCGKTRA